MRLWKELRISGDDIRPGLGLCIGEGKLFFNPSAYPSDEVSCRPPSPCCFKHTKYPTVPPACLGLSGSRLLYNISDSAHVAACHKNSHNMLFFMD